MANDVDRITLTVDHNWETFFIPWLEDQEKNNIGVEDGVFVATIDPSLRVLRPEDEEKFVKECAEKHLSTVSKQKLKQFTASGLYHLGTEKASGYMQKFKEDTSDLDSYKSDTCCTNALNQENGLEKVFLHLNSDVISLEKTLARDSVIAPETKTSRVLLEEAGLKMREAYEKYSQGENNFNWNAAKKVPPQRCPDEECLMFTDSEESDFVEENDNCEACDDPERSDENEDKPTLVYGHGLESNNINIKITANLNLSRIFNLLWMLPYFYPGFHSTYLYFGREHSFFPVHVEDALCWSLNYLHMGHPKIWVIIPPWATDLLEYHLHKGGIHLHTTKCRNLLGHKVILPTIQWLKERKIPYKIVVQRPGDLVILHPNSAHFGFSLGANIAQAVNIATKSWIPWGINAKKCNCWLKQIHIDMSTFVAAFRKDLLPRFLNKDVILTSQMVRGMQLLSTEISTIHLDAQLHMIKENSSKKMKLPVDGCNTSCPKVATNHGECSKHASVIKCPVKKCCMTFTRISDSVCKRNMILHVKRAHKPIVEKNELLKRINDLFLSSN